MSHDMRTPLNGIIGMAKLAKNHTEDADKTAETLSRIGQLGNQLLELINEILDISRMEEGKLELRIESFRIKEKSEGTCRNFPATDGRNRKAIPDPYRYRRHLYQRRLGKDSADFK